MIRTLKSAALMVLLTVMASQMWALATCVIPHSPAADHCKPDCPMMRGDAAQGLSPEPANPGPCHHSLSSAEFTYQTTANAWNADVCSTPLPVPPVEDIPVAGHPVNNSGVSPPMPAASLQALYCSFLI